VLLLWATPPEHALDLVEVLVVVHWHAVVYEIADTLQQAVAGLIELLQHLQT
jgi:hypothetical protein